MYVWSCCAELLLRAAKALQPETPSLSESLRKRPRKQVVKSPWQVEDDSASDGLRKSRRQQERASVEVPTTGLSTAPQVALNTLRVPMATRHPSTAKGAECGLPQAAKAPQRRSVRVSS